MRREGRVVVGVLVAMVKQAAVVQVQVATNGARHRATYVNAIILSVYAHDLRQQTR